MFSLTASLASFRQTAARLFSHRFIRVPALALLCSLMVSPIKDLNAVKAYVKSSTCTGTGQILSGEGRGGIVSLALSKHYVGNNTYDIQLGNDYFGGDRFSISPYSTRSRSYGSWIAEEINNSEIFITLQYRQPYVVVSYVLNC